ncbi:hypothetical protein Tco_0783576 [Tanacetum coccineum]
MEDDDLQTEDVGAVPIPSVAAGKCAGIETFTIAMDTTGSATTEGEIGGGPVSAMEGQSQATIDAACKGKSSPSPALYCFARIQPETIKEAYAQLNIQGSEMATQDLIKNDFFAIKLVRFLFFSMDRYAAMEYLISALCSV